MSYYESHEYVAKQETIKCAMWASVVVFGVLALLIHGIAFLSWTAPTTAEIYRNKRMQNQIEDLYQWRTGIVVDGDRKKIEYENHTHRYYDQKIRTSEDIDGKIKKAPHN